MEQFIGTGTQQRDVQNLESAVQKVFNSLYPNPFLKGVSIVNGNVFVSTNDLYVQHKLNRVPKGYLIINRNGAQTIYTSATVNVAPKSYMILKATGSVTADILFF